MSKLTKKLRDLSDEKLIKLLKSTEYEQIKASSAWARDKVNKKEAGIPKAAGKASKGDKTSLQKDLRRQIARILTILRERDIEV